MAIPVSADATNPASYLRAVTPHASNNLVDGPCRSLWVGTGGDISILAEGDKTAVIVKNVANGQILPIRAKAVRVTGTTATDIVALY